MLEGPGSSSQITSTSSADARQSGRVARGPEAPWHQKHLWQIQPVRDFLVVVCALVILPAMGLAALLSRAAGKASLGWRWPLTACLLLALLAGSVFSQTQPKTATKPGLFILGVGGSGLMRLGFYF